MTNPVICIALKDPIKKIAYQLPAGVVEYQGKWNKVPDKNGNIHLTYCILKGSTHIPDDHETAVAVRLALQSFSNRIAVIFDPVLPTQTPDLTYKFIFSSDDPVLKANPSATAYSGFPDSSNTSIHIILNDSDNWNFTGTNFGFNPLNTFIHETCHALGLIHSTTPTAVVYSFYNGVIDLDEETAQRLVNKYGVRIFASPTALQRLQNAIFFWKRKLK